MSLIVLVFWDGLTLSFYVYRASVRPKGSLAAWIPCGPGLVRGVKPTKSMDPTFSNRIRHIRHIRHVQLYISNHIKSYQPITIAVKNSPLSPGGLRELAEFRWLETLHSRTTSRHIYVANPSSRRIQHLVPKTSWGSADSETSKAAATASYILHRKVSLKL